MNIDIIREGLSIGKYSGIEQELAEFAEECYDDAAAAYSLLNAAEEHIKQLEEKIKCQQN